MQKLWSPTHWPLVSKCGQKHHKDSITAKRIVGEAVESVVESERGLIHTFFQLVRRPGIVVYDYTSGKTQPYTPPFKYLLLAFFICVAGEYLIDATSDLDFDGVNSSISYRLMFFAIPFSIVSWIMLRKKMSNLAGNFILSIYIIAQIKFYELFCLILETYFEIGQIYSLPAFVLLITTQLYLNIYEYGLFRSLRNAIFHVVASVLLTIGILLFIHLVLLDSENMEAFFDLFCPINHS